MPPDEFLYHRSFRELSILGFEKRLEINGIQIAAFFCEVSPFVENIGDASAHSGGEISTAGSQNQYQALGHIFATVVANSFDHGGCSRVANREALASDSIEKRLAASGAIERNVADQNIFFRSKCRTARWIHNQSSARQTLAHVI